MHADTALALLRECDAHCRAKHSTLLRDLEFQAVLADGRVIKSSDSSGHDAMDSYEREAAALSTAACARACREPETNTEQQLAIVTPATTSRAQIYPFCFCKSVRENLAIGEPEVARAPGVEDFLHTVCAVAAVVPNILCYTGSSQLRGLFRTCVFSSALCLHALEVFLLPGFSIDPAYHDNEALYSAVENGRTAVVARLLSDPRVNPSAPNHRALWSAVRGRHADIVDLLLGDSRTELECAFDYDAATTLHDAVGERILLALLAHFSKNSMPAPDRRRILLHACRIGFDNVLRKMLASVSDGLFDAHAQVYSIADALEQATLNDRVSTVKSCCHTSTLLTV